MPYYWKQETCDFRASFLADNSLYSDQICSSRTVILGADVSAEDEAAGKAMDEGYISHINARMRFAVALGRYFV
ncbi:hypothetical protein E4U47_000570 [Claviceps purpurea]|nr:hypothetical protein E4U28_001974 [Claviceps purpurea]KAG6275726.1 hypothetical protein E4U47_000570 [Claviceps purpurea]